MQHLLLGRYGGDAAEERTAGAQLFGLGAAACAQYGSNFESGTAHGFVVGLFDLVKDTDVDPSEFAELKVDDKALGPVGTERVLHSVDQAEDEWGLEVCNNTNA